MTQRKMRRWAAILGYLVFQSAPAWAQPPVALTVDEAINRGLAAAPRLAEAREREKAALAGVDARTALGRPTVSVLSSYLRTNHVDEFGIPQANGTTRVIFPDIPDNFRLRAEVQMPVWTSGRTSALTSAARADQEAALAERRTVEADLALEIASTYWQLVTARAAVGVLDEAMARTDAWVRDVEARIAAGVSAPHEAPQARAQRARQVVQRLQAQQTATLAERELARLTGLPPGTTISTISAVDRPSDALSGVTSGDSSAVYARALQARSERAALEHRSEAFRQAAAAAHAASRPQVGTFAAIEPARPNSRFVPRAATWHTSWDLGVSVTWSLWDGGRSRAERAQALAQAQALAYRQHEFDSRLQVEVLQRLLDIETGRAAVTAADELVAAAEEVHRVMRIRFDSGVATSTEVLDAHVAWLEAALERTRLQANLRMAESRLTRAAGGPLE